LGALGAKQGPAISYTWSPPSRLPQLLEPFALLLLLLPKRNRSVQALWVAAPVAFSLAVASLLWAIPGVGSDAPAGLLDVFGATAFGLGAAWLLSPYLKRRHRFLTFLGILVTMELVGVLVYVVARQWSRDGVPTEMLIGVALFGSLISMAIILAGRSCRGRFGRLRLSLWSLVWVTSGWLAFLVVMSVAAGHGPWLQMVMAWLMVSGVTFGVLLPFLVLSFANGFHRERLKELLRLEDPAQAEPEKISLPGESQPLQRQ
jgi:hypothetical protein